MNLTMSPSNRSGNFGEQCSGCGLEADGHSMTCYCKSGTGPGRDSKGIDTSEFCHRHPSFTWFFTVHLSGYLSDPTSLSVLPTCTSQSLTELALLHLDRQGYFRLQWLPTMLRTLGREVPRRRRGRRRSCQHQHGCPC